MFDYTNMTAIYLFWNKMAVVTSYESALLHLASSITRAHKPQSTMQAYKIETKKITYYSAKGTYQYCCTRGPKNTFSSFFSAISISKGKEHKER